MPKKIAPLLGDTIAPSMTSSSRRDKTMLEASGVVVILGGVLVAVFNILFIYFGMSSGWYYFRDSLGTELKVISVGEGIVTGLFYFIFGVISLSMINSGNHTVIMAINIVNTLIRNAFNMIIYL